jgi:hypothetical protein
MSTVTYTGSVTANPLFSPITLATLPDTPTQPTSCAVVTTSANLQTSAAAIKSTYFKDIILSSNLLNFQTALTTADTATNTGFEVTLSNALVIELNKLENTIIPIQQYVANCVDDYYEFNPSDYEKQVKATDESKSRLDAITTPEQHVSYYDGWFPLFRPMKESALFGLFAVSIFMLLLSVLIFLRMRGIEINIIMPQGSIDLSWMTKYIPYSGIGIGIGFAVAYILYKYYPSAIGM